MKTRRFLERWLILVGLLAVATFGMGNFGLNKVQFSPFEWRLVQTVHFDLYYYQGGDSLVAYAASEAEAIYDSSAAYLQHRLQQRIPIILHNTHAQFEQTNVMRFPIPEAVGGFTEIFKNRIVLPFDGSYTSFHHVLQHELLHAMVFDMVSNGRRGYNTAEKLGMMPLWANEGNSEYGSLGWDLGSEFYMLDAVTNGYLGNPGQDLPGYQAYKGGQNFWFFVESVWGKGSVAKIFKSISEGLPFPVAFTRVTRVSLDEAGEIWLREVRRIYWPELGRRQYAKTIARAMTDHRKEENFYNVNPALSPDGKRIAFFSDRGNWEAVYILDVESEQVTTTALESGFVASHESFHPFSSAIGWAPDSRHIVMVSKSNGRDVIHIVDTKGSNVICSIDPVGLEAASSPSISPDGKRIVFSGQRNSVQDLYMVELPVALGAQGLPAKLAQVPKALTHGLFTEDRPVFSPSGRYVAFESNRAADSTDRFIKDKLDVYLLDLTTDSLRRISKGRWSSHSPTFGEDDSLIVYVSNRSGTENMYMQETFADTLWPVSNVISAVSSPSWSKSGNSIAFCLFEDGGWDVYLQKDPWKQRHLAPLPRTRFMEVAEDTTGSQRIFENIAFENLKTYKSKQAMDSLESAIKEHMPEPPGKGGKVSEPTPVIPNDDGGFFLDEGKRPPKVTADTAKKDSVRKDSTKADTVALDTMKSIHPKVYLDSAKADSAKIVPFAGLASVPADTAKGQALAKDTVKTDSIRAIAKGSMSDVAPGWDAPDTSSMFMKGGKELSFNADGSLRSTPYVAQWTLDQAVAVAGFSSSNGVGGEGSLTFSDLMGDQEINLWFFGGGSLDNLNLFVNYGYLPHQVDISTSVFQTYREGNERMSLARYMQLHDSVPLPGDDTLWGTVPYSDVSRGAALDFIYPFSLYSRLDLSTELDWRTRSWFQLGQSTGTSSLTSDLKKDSIAHPETMNTLSASLSWSFDNAQWGVSGPVAGQRLWAGVQGIVPGVLQDSYGYWRADVDMRKYFLLFRRYTFAFRAAGGMSEPIQGYQDPHKYLLGGDDWTINWHFNDDHWHGSQSEIFFSSWETPLRGFRYHDFIGSRMGVVNAEFRFPFIDRLSFGWPIPLTITNVTGVLFSDYGGTWDNQDVLHNRGWGYGWGWRLNLGVFVLRYTRAWSSQQYSTIDLGGDGYTYWSLGAEF